MTGREVLAKIAQALEHDVRRRYPHATVRPLAAADGDRGVVVEWGDGEGGTASTWVDDEDELSAMEAEGVAVDLIFEVTTNMWPDDDVWPVCPVHGDHPLQPRLSRGRGSWTCWQNGSVAVPFGDL